MNCKCENCDNWREEPGMPGENKGHCPLVSQDDGWHAPTCDWYKPSPNAKKIPLELMGVPSPACREHCLTFEHKPEQCAKLSCCEWKFPKRAESHELKKKGGKWLGACRSWIQHHCINGDRVTWNSDDSVGTMTVRQLEDLASKVAAAAINSFIDKHHLIINEYMEGD